MMLSLTTNRGWKTLDVMTGQSVSRHEGSGRYFGQTWDTRAMWVGCNRDNHPYAIKVNRNLEPTVSHGQQEIDPSNQHGMFFDPHTAKFYWCIPGKDSIFISPDMLSFETWLPSNETDKSLRDRTDAKPARKIVLSRKGEPFPQERQKFQRWDGPGTKNTHHYNSIFVTQTRIYISSFNPGGTSEILEFDHARSLLSRASSGKMVHTVWYDGSALCWIDTGGKSVKRNGVAVYHSEATGEFLRGIAWDGTNYYLGISTHNRNRQQRLAGSGRGKIRVLTEDWQPVRDIDLPDGCSQIYEIRALCADERTHNGLRPPIE